MNTDPGTVASWAQILGTTAEWIIVPLCLFFWRLFRRMSKQDKAIEDNAAQTAEVKAMLERQFGSNGFVLHEKVKAQGEALAVVREGLADHVKSHVDRSFGR